MAANVKFADETVRILYHFSSQLKEDEYIVHTAAQRTGEVDAEYNDRRLTADKNSGKSKPFLTVEAVDANRVDEVTLKQARSNLNQTATGAYLIELLQSGNPLVPTGIGVRSGTAADLGISELEPTGLAAAGGTLYGVGSGGYLFRVNLSTGEAHRVGDADRFGLDEPSPQSLAVITTNEGGGEVDTLYCVGSKGFLFTINTATGVGTRVGNETNFGSAVNESSPTGLATVVTKDQNNNSVSTLYCVGSAQGKLFTINTSTGVGALVHGTNTLFSDTPRSVAKGLAAHNANLYGVATISTTVNDATTMSGYLFSVNTTTGIGTRISSVENFGIGVTDPAGISFVLDKLYAFATRDESRLKDLEVTTNNKSVYAWIEGGIPGRRYKVYVTVDTSDGQRLKKDATITVK